MNDREARRALWLAEFEVPRRVGLEVCGNPAQSRGVFFAHTGKRHVTEMLMHALPSQDRRIFIHRAIGAPRLLSKVGAIVHTGRCSMFELQCLHDPRGRGVTLYGEKGWLCEVGGVSGADGSPVVLYKLLDPERMRELFVWLAGWVNDPYADKHSATERGYQSEREYQEMTRPMYEEPDPDRAY